MVIRWSVFYLVLTSICLFAEEKDLTIKGNREISYELPAENKKFKNIVFENKFKIMGATAGLCLALPIADSLPNSIVQRMGRGLTKMDRMVDKTTNLVGWVIKANYRKAFFFGVPLYIGYKAGSMVDKN